MSFGKGLDDQVNKVIDQAADVAKDKIGTMMGGGQKKEKKPAGVGDMVTGAITKAAANQAADNAADKVLSMGKNLFG